MERRYYFKKQTKGGLTILSLPMDSSRREYFLKKINESIEVKSEQYTEISEEEYLNLYDPDL